MGRKVGGISLEIRRGRVKKLSCNRVTGISHLLDLMKFLLKRSFLIIQCETEGKNRYIFYIGLKIRKFIGVAKKKI